LIISPWFDEGIMLALANALQEDGNNKIHMKKANDISDTQVRPSRHSNSPIQFL
jgi:hypothetical protein